MMDQFNLNAPSLALLIMMLTAALIGAIHPEVYRDNAQVSAGWRGNDLVTIFLAALTIATLMAGGAGTELMLWSALGMGSLLASTFLLSNLKPNGDSS